MHGGGSLHVAFRVLCVPYQYVGKASRRGLEHVSDRLSTARAGASLPRFVPSPDGEGFRDESKRLRIRALAKTARDALEKKSTARLAHATNGEGGAERRRTPGVCALASAARDVAEKGNTRGKGRLGLCDGLANGSSSNLYPRKLLVNLAQFRWGNPTNGSSSNSHTRGPHFTIRGCYLRTVAGTARSHHAHREVLRSRTPLAPEW